MSYRDDPDYQNALEAAQRKVTKLTQENERIQREHSWRFVIKEILDNFWGLLVVMPLVLGLGYLPVSCVKSNLALKATAEKWAKEHNMTIVKCSGTQNADSDFYCLLGDSQGNLKGKVVCEIGCAFVKFNPHE